VKEVIQAVINVTLVKMESLKDFRNQFETKILWAKVSTKNESLLAALFI
jgi:hypothetical protein